MIGIQTDLLSDGSRAGSKNIDRKMLNPQWLGMPTRQPGKNKKGIHPGEWMPLLWRILRH
jgi:hypothetical protein